MVEQVLLKARGACPLQEYRHGQNCTFHTLGVLHSCTYTLTQA